MFWKIFSGVWLYSWKYYRKHIFYLLLTFSQLPNKYIIPNFLNRLAVKIEKQNLTKKIHQIQRSREREIEQWSRTMERTAASVSFGSRMRSVLGGSVLGGDDLGSAGVRWSCRCWDATRWCLDVRSKLSLVLLFLSLFYFPGIEINCRENKSVKYFTGFWGMIYSQRKSFSVWLNFQEQSKHTQWCKIFSRNYLPQKQTQP